MIYLFLDIDGVLNNYDTTERCQGFIGIDPDKVKLLKHIIDVTHAEIVLTSTWKYEWEPIDKTKNEYAGDYLDAALAAEGLTAIDKTTDNWSNRGEGIQNWLKEHPAKAWVVLDDMYFDDFDKMGITPHLLLTASDEDYEGLTLERADQAINMIQEQGVQI